MSLEVYARDLSAITADLNLFIDDLRLKQSGKRIIYAPDFSELYALVNPGITNAEFRTFGDDNLVERGIAQSSALNRIFFSEDVKIVLLPTYKYELHVWLIREREQRNEEIAELARRAAVELKGLTADTQFINILGIIGNSDDLATDKNAEQVIQYFESKAGNLVRLLDEAVESPVGLLKRVFDSPGLAQFEELTITPLPHDSAVYGLWCESLAKARRKEAKLTIANDALAVAQVFSANINDDDLVVRIVTRSLTMRDLAAKTCETDHWKRAHGNPIRHPRVFGYLRSLSQESSQQAIDSAERMINAIRSFLESLSGGAVQGIDEEKVGDIEKIKEQWHAGAQIGATVTAAESPERYRNVRNSSRKRVLEVLGRVRDRESLRSVLVNRVALLVGEIEQDYINLGYSIQAISKRLDLFPQEVSVIIDEHTTLITSSAFYNPYYIYFHSEGMRSLGRQLKAEPDFNVLHISNWLLSNDATADPLFTHEKLLLMAFMFSISDEWDLADRYVDAALQVVDRRHEIDTTEAQFLKLLCISRGSHREGYLDAFQQLDEIKLVQAPVRLVCERSSLAFRFGVGARLDKYFAVSLANQALDQLNNPQDQSLLILMHNNLTYYYLTTDPNSKKAHTTYQHLKTLIQKNNIREDKLWPNVLDTYYWGRWVLEKKSLTREACNEILVRLENILTNAAPSRPWHATIRKHILDIKGTL